MVGEKKRFPGRDSAVWDFITVLWSILRVKQGNDVQSKVQSLENLVGELQCYLV
jgi:hypothetical protein